VPPTQPQAVIFGRWAGCGDWGPIWRSVPGTETHGAAQQPRITTLRGALQPLPVSCKAPPVLGDPTRGGRGDMGEWNITLSVEASQGGTDSVRADDAVGVVWVFV
jgi:hypothetical protein